MLCLADEQRTTSTSFGRTDPIVVTVLNSRSSRSRQVLPRAFRELPEQPRGLTSNELVSRIETCFDAPDWVLPEHKRSNFGYADFGHTQMV